MQEDNDSEDEDSDVEEDDDESGSEIEDFVRFSKFSFLNPQLKKGDSIRIGPHGDLDIMPALLAFLNQHQRTQLQYLKTRAQEVLPPPCFFSCLSIFRLTALFCMFVQGRRTCQEEETPPAQKESRRI